MTFTTASDQASRLIVTLTEAISLLARLGKSYRRTKKRENPRISPASPSIGPPRPYMRRRCWGASYTIELVGSARPNAGSDGSTSHLAGSRAGGFGGCEDGIGEEGRCRRPCHRGPHVRARRSCCVGHVPSRCHRSRRWGRVARCWSRRSAIAAIAIVEREGERECVCCYCYR